MDEHTEGDDNRVKEMIDSVLAESGILLGDNDQGGDCGGASAQLNNLSQSTNVSIAEKVLPQELESASFFERFNILRQRLGCSDAADTWIGKIAHSQ